MSLENVPYCDIFYPTYEEFQNFEKYVESCEKNAKSAIIKIVPPKYWKARKDDYINLEFTIPSPIEQIVTGSAGLFEVVLIQRESRTLTKYKKLVESFDKLTADKNPTQIEKMFWKNLKFSAPLYGADSPGSIFDPDAKWNLSKLDSVLKKGLNNEILGVTSPYLYFGAWKTLFAWHKEDMDLYSINFLHLGKPKYWYAVALEDSQKFEEFMRKSFPDAYRDCKEFIRHKNFLVHPQLLLNQGIKLHKCVQKGGEFVITLAGGYHSGFNSGFNIAEAVNFALKRWLDIGIKADSCKCRGDSVRIDMEKFIANIKEYKRKKKLTKTRVSKENMNNKKIQTNFIKCVECETLRIIPKGFKLSKNKKFKCNNLNGIYCDQESNLKSKKRKNILNGLESEIKKPELNLELDTFNLRRTIRRKRKKE